MSIYGLRHFGKLSVCVCLCIYVGVWEEGINVILFLQLLEMDVYMGYVGSF